MLALARGGLIDAPGIAGAPPAALAALAAAAAGMGGALSRRPFVRAGAAPSRGRWWRRWARPPPSSPSCSRSTTPSGWTPIPRSRSARCCATCRPAVTLVLATAPYPPRPELDELRSRIGRDLEGGVITPSPARPGRAPASGRSDAARIRPAALDRVVRRVANDSAGLPLLAVELLRAVALGLDLGTISGAWPEPLRTLDQSLPGDLPDAVITAIRVASRRLTPAAQRVLVAAAVLGDLATPPVLERALGLSADEVARALDELEWHRWLTAEPRGLLVRRADRAAGGGAGHGDRRPAAPGAGGRRSAGGPAAPERRVALRGAGAPAPRRIKTPRRPRRGSPSLPQSPSA